MLLPPGTAGRRLGGHVDPGRGAVAARAPGALGADDAPVRVQLRRRLAEVPDIAAAVLRVPVGRALGEPALEVETVLDDDAGRAVDRLRPVRDGDDVARGLAVLHAAVDVDGAGPQREPGIVDG